MTTSKDDIVRALGSSSSKDRHPCPVCGGKHCVAVDDSLDKPLVHCHQHQCDVWGWLKEKDIVGSQETRPTKADWKAARKAEREKEEAKFEQAWSILYRARKTKKWPRRYLKSRGITTVPKCAMLLQANAARDLPSKDASNPCKRERRRFSNYPAAVFPVVNKDGIVGTHVIALNRKADCKLALNDGSPKRSYGNIKGGYVQLGRPDPNLPLIVAEGVETALSASQIAGGLPAIATLGTSGMKSLASIPLCSEAIIARDRDTRKSKRAARNAAEQLAAKLDRQGRTVRIAPPPKGSGKDWNDALQSGQDLKMLKRKLLRAEQYRKPIGPWPRTREEIMSLEFPPLKHYLKPILPESSMLQFHAPKGHGKTRLVMSMAEAIYLGGELLGWKCEKQASVLYLDGELPRTRVQQRLARIEESNGRLVVLNRHLLRADGYQMPQITTTEGREQIDGMIEELGIDVIILDSYSTLVGGDEMDLEYWQDIADWMSDWRGRGKGIILVMHEGVTTGRARGPTKRTDTFDATMRIEHIKDRDTDDEVFFKVEMGPVRDVDELVRPLIVKTPRHGKTNWEFVEYARPGSARTTKARERRERVLELHAEGMSKKDIAQEVGLTTTERVRQIIREEENDDNLV